MAERKADDVLKQLVPRGFLESYILLTLKGGPLNGYKIIQKINERTGFWKPSPGTVYPALHSMLRKRFIKEVKGNGRGKEYALTERGLELAKEVEEIETRMREKATEVLSKILNLDKEELKRFFENTRRKYNENPLSRHIHSMLRLLLRISDRPEKVVKAAEIIKETNLKLRRISSSRV